MQMAYELILVRRRDAQIVVHRVPTPLDSAA